VSDDKDQDGISDDREAALGFLSTNWDTDGDGTADGDELVNGYPYRKRPDNFPWWSIVDRTLTTGYQCRRCYDENGIACSAFTAVSDVLVRREI
jgi:hypothetical protein